jgi:hypothetical protein
MNNGLQTSNIGRDFKDAPLKQEIKKLDTQFKRSFILGALFIGASFLLAAYLGFALLSIVTLVLGAVLGVGSLVWRVYPSPSEKKPEEKLDGSPPGLNVSRRIPLELSDAKMHELGDEIFSKPSLKRPNRL